MMGRDQMRVKLKDVPTLANLLRDEVQLAHSHQRISARPWNRFKPEQSLWWIIPSTTWPAYQHGKFFFTQDRTSNDNPDFWDSNRLFLGLHVESGLSKNAASAYAAREPLVRNPDWLWDSFLVDLSEGAVAETSRTVHRKTGTLLSVVVETSYPSGNGPDRGKWELLGRMKFSFDGYRLTPNPYAQSKSILELKDVRSLDELRKRLLDLARLQWVDLFLGVVIATESAETTDEQDVAEIWKFLAPWDEWFV